MTLVLTICKICFQIIREKGLFEEGKKWGYEYVDVCDFCKSLGRDKNE